MSDNLVVGASWCSWTRRQLDVIRTHGGNPVDVCFTDTQTESVPRCPDDVAKRVTAYPSFVRKTGEVSPGYKDAEDLTRYLSKGA